MNKPNPTYEADSQHSVEPSEIIDAQAANPKENNDTNGNRFLHDFIHQYRGRLSYLLGIAFGISIGLGYKTQPSSLPTMGKGDTVGNVYIYRPDRDSNYKMKGIANDTKEMACETKTQEYGGDHYICKTQKGEHCMATGPSLRTLSNPSEERDYSVPCHKTN